MFKVFPISGFLLLALAMAGCNRNPEGNTKGDSRANQEFCIEFSKGDSCSLFLVSILGLIATPGNFDGEQVRTAGFLECHESGAALYFDENSFKNHLVLNGIRLELDRKNGDKEAGFCGHSGSYVLVQGRFQRKAKGERNLFAGNLLNASVESRIGPSTHQSLDSAFDSKTD